MKIIDIRSDTVTKPSKQMLEAMMSAEVGDDVFGEDPTVNALQDKCSELTGKEASLFVTSGCLGNQLAIKSHTSQGNEVIVEKESHIINYETAAPAIISNVQLMPLEGINGVMSVKEIEKHIKGPEYYFPVTTLLCLENTHNRAGGTIQPIESIKEIRALTKKHNIKMHLDGARIFNAIQETGISLIEYSAYFDSVQFCFSKGLGAPVGSILCGSKEFITKAHKWRKILGGGMRQAGILAAAGIFALDNNIPLLKKDNGNAKYFASQLANIDGININPDLVHTNIVVFSTNRFSKNELIEKLDTKGVRISSGAYDNLRAVFNLNVSKEDTENAVITFKIIFQNH
jgi:threonine aldolase